MVICSHTLMKLSQWASKNGLTYKTAYNLFKAGNLPCKATQLATGTILVDEVNTQINELKTYIYCRVSSYQNKSNLDLQAERCLEFARTNGWQVEKVIKEVASGMNDSRNKLLKLLDKTPKRIIIEHKDRLTRFGFKYFEQLLPLLNYELVVINRDKEDEKDLLKDLVSIITSFCCRLYGLRRGTNKIKNIKQIISDVK
jgi:putative resolvase